MSQVKRYNWTGTEMPDGEHVSYEDYAQLERTNAALLGALKGARFNVGYAYQPRTAVTIAETIAATACSKTRYTIWTPP